MPIYNPNNSSQGFSFLQSLLLLILIISCLFHVQPLHFKGRKLRREKNRSIFPTGRQLQRGNFYPSPQRFNQSPTKKPWGKGCFGKGNSIHFALVIGSDTPTHIWWQLVSHISCAYCTGTPNISYYSHFTDLQTEVPCG